MKALSIKQPYAALIALGLKDVENRTWPTHYRGRILIHASLKPGFTGSYKGNLPPGYWMELGIKDPAKQADVIYHAQFRKAIIGSVEIVDCVQNHPSMWAGQSIPRYNHVIWNWVLANPILFTDVIENVNGALSLWEYDVSENSVPH